MKSSNLSDQNHSQMTKGNIDLGLLILRLWFGLEMALAHGLGKMIKIFSGNFEFSDPLGMGPTLSLILAGSAEFFCGLLIAAGFFTRLALLPFIFTMLVAAFVVHIDDGWNRMVLPLHYVVAGIVLLITGPGRYSLDEKIS
jgi:putative oxidoreductase